jgi:YggT family protein
LTLFYPPTNILLILADLLQVLFILILVDVIASWAMMMGSLSARSPWLRTLRKITDPILEPFRRIVPPQKMGGLDISPMLAIILIQVVQNVLVHSALRQSIP